MNKIFLIALISILVIELGALTYSVGQTDFGINFGIISLIGTLVCLVLGIFLCIPKSSREIGKGLLIASGLLFVIGLSVCSQSKVF